MATLAVYRGDQLLRQVELSEGRTRIGRSPENELVLEDRDKGVSRAHAEIRYDRGQYVIVDLNSQNGVWIGERRVKTDPLPVDGPITIGPYRLLLLPDPPLSESVDSAGTLVTADAEERFAEPTELVQQEGQVGRTRVGPAPAVPWWQKRTGLMTLAGIGVLAAALLVITIVSRPDAPAPPPIGGPPAPPPPEVSEATATEEAAKKAEQQFQQHYANAQGYIETGDKASALAENAEALNVLPADPRAVEQGAQIAAMIEQPGPDTGGAAVSGAAVPSPPPPGLPSTLRITPRTGETASQRNGREKLARVHLDDGKKALSERRYGEAVDLLQAALDTSGRPDYGYAADEAQNLLRSARASKATSDANARHAAAQKLMEQAKALAGSDIAGAVQKLREARNLDAQLQGAAELLASLQDQAAVQGESALSRAKNFDRFKRVDEAIREFNTAVQLLEVIPGGHKDLAFARQRMAELKTPR